jgi:hypothetical protein
MSYDNTNRGQIWGNDKKEKDTHPDFKGSVNVEGVEYWVSGWKRKPDAHPKAPALSFSLQKKETANEALNSAPPQQQSAPPAAPEIPNNDSFDDDIPF